MTLPDLHHRIGTHAARHSITAEAMIANAGLRSSTLRRASRGQVALNTATVIRLLALVAQVAAPGEAVALTLRPPGARTQLHITTAPL